MTHRLRTAAFLLAALALLQPLAPVTAQDAGPPQQVLFRNVMVFDGKSGRLERADVLVTENRISEVSAEPLMVIQSTSMRVIDGGGRTLMPGLIDNHVHFSLTGATLAEIENNMTWEDIAYNAVPTAEMYLMEGFTTVRDAGGSNAGLRRAIDGRLILGPRVYTSGAFLGGRGGHADFAPFTALPGAQTNMSRLNISQDVNGVDAMTVYARNNFRMGNTQLKVMQSGGVVSLFDPWQMNGATPQEMAAAVAIAESYGSYVMAHSYRKASIIAALEAGVKTIEHGFMFDREIADLMKEKRAYITTNLTAFAPGLFDIDAVKNDPRSLRKAKSATAAFGDYIENVRKYRPKRGFHTDCVGRFDICRKQVAYEKYLNGEFFGNHRALVAMTSVGGEIAALSGGIVNPYPDGKLGVIEPGAYADLLIVDGNPLEDLAVIGSQDKWFDGPDRPEGVETIRLIMKDGQIYKNTL